MKSARSPEVSAALSAVIAQITSCPDPGGTVHAALDAVREAFRAEVGILRLYHEASAHLMLAAAAGLTPQEERWVAPRVPVEGDEVSALAARSRAPLCLNSLGEQRRLTPAPGSGLVFSSILCLPLLIQDRLLGTLQVASRRPGAFGPAEVALAGPAAQLVALAMDRAALHDEAHRAGRRAGALAALAQAISSSLDLDEVLSLLVERTALATEMDAAAILERDADTGRLRFRRAHGLSAPYLEGIVLPPGGGISGAALATGHPQWTADILADPRFALPEEAKRLATSEGVRAVLSVPIRFTHGLFGALNLYCRDARTFDQAEIDFAVQIADQAAVAIENARLFRHEQERRRQVEAVREVTEEITRELDLPTLLGVIIRRALQLVGAGAGAVYLWDEEANLLVPKAWHGMGDWIQDVRPRLGRGITGLVAHQRRGMIVNDYRRWPQANPLFLEHSGLTAVLAEPLLYRDRLLGVIALNNEGTDRPFGEQDRELLALFAGQAAIAIENARLLQDARTRAARREAFARLSAAIARGTDRGAILRQVVEATAQLLDAPYAALWTPDPGRPRLIASTEFVDPGLGPLPPQPPIPLDRSYAGTVFLEQQPLVTPDVRHDPRWANGDWPGLERLGAYVGLRLAKDEVLVGALVAMDCPGRRFTSDEVQLLQTLGTHASLAIEKAELLEAAREAAARAQALVEVGRVLTASLDLDRVLDLMLHEVQRLMGAPFVGILTLDEQRQELAYSKGAGLSPERMAQVLLRLGEGIVGRAAAEGVPLQSCNLLRDPRYMPLGLEVEGFRSILCAPLVSRGRALGALAVFRKDEHEFAPPEVELLGSFAAQAAIAIENASLFRQEQDRRRQLEAVRSVTEEIARELDLPTLLGLIHRRASELVGAGMGVVYLWDETGQVLVPHAWHGVGDWMAEVRLALGEGTAGIVAQGRQGMIFNDYRDSSYVHSVIGEASDVAAVLAEPLLYRHRLLGVVTLGHREAGRAFTEQDRETLALFAAQAAVAIENARLYQEAAEVAQHQAALLETGAALNAAIAQEGTLQLIIDKAVETVGAEKGALFAYDSLGQELFIVAARGVTAEGVEKFRLRLGESVAGRAILWRRPVVIPDVDADTEHNVRMDHARREGIRAFLCLPLVADDEVVGAISLYRRQPTRFSDADIAHLTLFANQAAVAMANARLLKAEQARRRQVEAVRTVTEEITRELDLPTLLALIHRRARDLVGGAAGVIWLWDEEDQLLVPGASHGFGAWLRDLRLRLGEGLAGVVAQRREGLVVNNLRECPYVGPIYRRHPGLTAALAEPLLYRDRLLGVITLNQSDERQFTEQDRETLALFAGQAAVAIENARLFRQEQDRRRQVEAVRAVTAEIARELDLPTLLTLIHRRASDLVGAEMGAVYLWDEEAQVLIPQAWHGLGDWMGELRQAVGEGLAGTVAHQREGMIVNDYRDWPHVHPVILERSEATAVLAEPLLYRDRLLGVVILGHGGRERPFTEQDRETLALFAGQAAVAIENARLYTETHRTLEELAAIHEAGQAIAQSLDLGETLQRILAPALRLTKTDKGIIWLLDEARQELTGTVLHGLPGEAAIHLPLSETALATACLRERRVLTSECPDDDPRCHVALQGRFKNKALIAVPLRSGERVIGVLDLGDLKRARQFTPREMGILERLAQQAAVAIENARLYAEARTALDELRATQDQLVQVEKLRALGEMAGGVAHDFNNMLTAILGQAQLLKLRGAGPQVREGLELIERAALDGAETVRRILGFARVHPDSHFAPVEVGTLVSQVLEVTRPRWKTEAQARGGPIEARLALEPVPPVQGNAGELREVLVNLIFNAVDAMPQGGRLTLGARRLFRPGRTGGALNPHLEVLAHAPEQTQEVVEITVRDTGVGMSEAVRRRAFEPFFTTKGVSGSGLGLSVVYGIISRHRGDLLLESQEGAGTTVTIRLPATAPIPAEAGVAAQLMPVRPGRIVVVDDEKTLAEVLADLLRLQRHQVQAFTDPRRALEHLAREPADLLFTDLGMPEMSGWEVARLAGEIRPGLPVVLVTGWGHQVDPAQVRRRRIDAVVAKPYRIEDILRVVADLLPAPPPGPSQI